ncbi:MAG: cupin domain-containing protein [Sediminispirochaetaceae bacterium]
MKYLMYAEDAAWQPHPAGFPGVEMKILRSKKSGEYKESIAFVKIAVGAAVPPHVHEGEDDSLYITSGRAHMRVADERFPLAPGAQVTVPAGVEHEIYDVSEELIIYDVFAPRIF